MEFNKYTNNNNNNNHNNNNNNDRPSPSPEIRGMFGNKGDSQDWLGKYSTMISYKKHYTIKT